MANAHLLLKTAMARRLPCSRLLSHHVHGARHVGKNNRHSSRKELATSTALLPRLCVARRPDKKVSKNGAPPQPATVSSLRCDPVHPKAIAGLARKVVQKTSIPRWLHLEPIRFRNRALPRFVTSSVRIRSTPSDLPAAYVMFCGPTSCCAAALEARAVMRQLATAAARSQTSAEASHPRTCPPVGSVDRNSLQCKALQRTSRNQLITPRASNTTRNAKTRNVP